MEQTKVKLEVWQDGLLLAVLSPLDGGRDELTRAVADYLLAPAPCNGARRPNMLRGWTVSVSDV